MENKAGRVRWMQRLKKKVQNNKKKILSCLLIVFIYFVFFFPLRRRRAIEILTVTSGRNLKKKPSLWPLSVYDHCT